jgi:hypothetical protein
VWTWSSGDKAKFAEEFLELAEAAAASKNWAGHVEQFRRTSLRSFLSKKKNETFPGIPSK